MIVRISSDKCYIQKVLVFREQLQRAAAVKCVEQIFFGKEDIRTVSLSHEHVSRVAEGSV